MKLSVLETALTMSKEEARRFKPKSHAAKQFLLNPAPQATLISFELKIENFGHAMSEESLASFFIDFDREEYRGTSAFNDIMQNFTTLHFDETQLSLSVSKLLVELLGGTVTIEC